jgi:glycosyltransferase involved in cell wall biosynthesis
MKILHVAPSIERAYGGPTQSLAGYISASRTTGSAVDVAAPLPSQHEVDVLIDAGARRVETFPGYGRGSTAASPALVRWVGAHARDYDVIHVHGLFNFISTFAARSAIHAGSAVVIRPFGTLSRYTFSHRRGALKRPWFENLERPNLNRAAGVHFTTNTERDEAEWNDIRLGERAHVVPPPFMVSAESPRGKSDRKVVLFLGRFHPVKNLHALIDAWPSVVSKHPDAVLRIAGEGSRAYEQKLRQKAGGSSIEFTGFLSGSDKAAALANATVLVLPSLHENFGIVVVEAIAAGLPVVVSEHVQLRDFIAANDLGIVALDSADSIAQALSTALGDTALQSRVASHGRRLVDLSYNPETIGKQLETMYLSALDVRRRRIAGS